MKLETVLIAESWFKAIGVETTVDRDACTLDILVTTKKRNGVWVQVSNEEIEFRAEQVLQSDW